MKDSDGRRRGYLGQAEAVEWASEIPAAPKFVYSPYSAPIAMHRTQRSFFASGCPTG